MDSNLKCCDYIMELKGRLQTAHEIVRQKPIHHKAKSKECDNKSTELLTLEAGQKVLLYDETVHRGRSKKLHPQYIGSCDVVQ
jgi:hypothetical protein